MILIDGKKYLDIKDSCSQVTICHPDIIPKENMLEQERITFKKQKAKHAAYILPHSASSTLWAVYKLIMQATH